MQEPVGGVVIVSGVEQGAAKAPLGITPQALIEGEDAGDGIVTGTCDEAQVKGQVIGAIGCGPFIEVAAVEVAIAVTVPAPRGIGVGVEPGALASLDSVFLARADPLTMGAGAGDDGGAIAGDGEGRKVTEQALLGRRVDEEVLEEVLEQVIGTGGAREAAPALDAVDEPFHGPRMLGRQFLALDALLFGFDPSAPFLPVGRPFAEPEAIEEVVQGADARGIARRKATEDGEEGDG
ncbi:MAG: hypothetical protein Q8R28_23900, partial [Dehalococcoidia bacterium]|nr:hypothetical protein [Dehalococcoidia bacterium]